VIDERYRELERRYYRLLVAAENVIAETRAVGTPAAPLCSVPPHRIKRLREELDGGDNNNRPRRALATMGQ
jgi:hypothetical protein